MIESGSSAASTIRRPTSVASLPAKAAIETADAALGYNKKNYKASFRKARALKEQGYFEKAEKILEELIKDGDPNGASSRVSCAKAWH